MYIIIKHGKKSWSLINICKKAFNSYSPKTKQCEIFGALILNEKELGARSLHNYLHSILSTYMQLLPFYFINFY